MSLAAVYMAFVFICTAEATAPPCNICGSPYVAPAPAPDSPPPADDSLASAPIPSPDLSGTDIPAPPEGVFDVTLYGAVADGMTESSLAFLAAWDDACDYEGNSTLFIPNGTFFLSPISFSGPCYNQQSPKIEIRGTLKAPSSINAFPNPTWIMFRRLQGIKLTGGTGSQMATFDAQGKEAWIHSSCHENMKCSSPPRSLRFDNISNGTISNIALLNSKNFHMSFSNSENIHIHCVNISAPWNSPNTDGIHISYSTNITISSSTIGVGDDCVSIGPGSTNISISNITCGPGHGISIGSLGKYKNEKDVIGVRVRNCTIRDTDNGVRIKTWPGSPASKASNLTFEDIVMINVSNPIIIDQEYCPWHSCTTSKPSLVKLSNISFKNIRGTSKTKPAVTFRCSSIVPCENIQLVDVRLNYTTEDGPQTSLSVKGALHGVQILGFH